MTFQFQFQCRGSNAEVYKWPFPLGFWSGSIASRHASYHFQNRSLPTPLRYENHAEKKSVPIETEGLSDMKTGTER